MVGRKLEFDREEALEKAMNLFWFKGYNATGLNDLLNHMGIQRQSLYNTFGSKHALFLEAIRYYSDTVVRSLEQQLDAPGEPLENIRNLLKTLAENAARPQYRGCLVANTIMELAPHDKAVEEAVGIVVRQLEQAFERALKKAVVAGELSASTNPRELACFLYHVVLGINVRGKASLSCSSIDDILKVALSVLK